MYRIHILLFDMLNWKIYLLLLLSFVGNGEEPCTSNMLDSFRNGFSFCLKAGKTFFFFFNFVISIFLNFIYLFIYLFLAVLDLRFCARAFSSCSERGPLFIAVPGPLTIVTSLVVEHGLQTHRLSSCGSRTRLLRDMWDLPRPGLEPVSPALAGRFLTTAPPGKPSVLLLVISMFKLSISSWFSFVQL